MENIDAAKISLTILIATIVTTAAGFGLVLGLFWLVRLYELWTLIPATFLLAWLIIFSITKAMAKPYENI